MKRSTRTAASMALAFTLVLGVGVRADTRKASALLREAEVKDTVLGDVRGAIVLYQRAVIEANGDRGMVARALLALASAEQKIGESAARETYQRLLREFGDQKDYAATAAERLAAMGSVAGGRKGGDDARRLLTLDDTGWVDVAPDGHTAIAAVRDRLMQYDVASGNARELIPAVPRQALVSPKFAPDGHRVAYAVNGGGTDHPVLMIGDTAGGAPRAVASAAPGMVVITPVGWSANGNAIFARTLTTNTTGVADESLVWFSVTDGSARVAHRFARNVTTIGTALSPDGRAVAYVTRASAADTRITVLDLQNGTESQVVKFAARNSDPLWTPDGSHLIFQSDRGARPALWAVPMAQGAATGEPFLLLPGAAVPLRVTTSGTLMYTQKVGGGYSAFVMERAGGGVRIISQFGGSSATFSPDGKSLAYISDAGNGLIVRAIDSGEERRYTVAGMAPVCPRWMPDSNHLMIVAQDGGAADQAFFMVDRSTGDVTRLFSVNTPDHHRSAAGALSPDGRTLYASVRMNAASPWSHVVAIDLATGKEGVAIEIPGGFPPFSDAPALAVSPDGSLIAVQGSTGGAHSRIVTLSLTGAAPHVTVPDFLPVGTQIDEKLRWTDNGQSLLFVARAATSGSHSWKLMRVPAAGGPAQVDYDSDATDIKWGKPWSLDVSPDGTRFVVAGSIEGHVELWSRDLGSALNAR